MRMAADAMLHPDLKLAEGAHGPERQPPREAAEVKGMVAGQRACIIACIHHFLANDTLRLFLQRRDN